MNAVELSEFAEYASYFVELLVSRKSAGERKFLMKVPAAVEEALGIRVLVVE